MGCEKITTQHMLHHLHSTPPPHSMELLPKALPEVTHRSSEHLETVLLANQQGEHLCNPQVVTEGNQTTVC